MAFKDSEGIPETCESGDFFFHQELPTFLSVFLRASAICLQDPYETSQPEAALGPPPLHPLQPNLFATHLYLSKLPHANPYSANCLIRK